MLKLATIIKTGKYELTYLVNLRSHDPNTTGVEIFTKYKYQIL